MQVAFTNFIRALLIMNHSHFLPVTVICPFSGPSSPKSRHCRSTWIPVMCPPTARLKPIQDRVWFKAKCCPVYESHRVITCRPMLSSTPTTTWQIGKLTAWRIYPESVTSKMDLLGNMELHCKTTVTSMRTQTEVVPSLNGVCPWCPQMPMEREKM